MGALNSISNFNQIEIWICTNFTTAEGYFAFKDAIFAGGGEVFLPISGLEGVAAHVCMHVG